jgi:hypothetical protein
MEVGRQSPPYSVGAGIAGQLNFADLYPDPPTRRPYKVGLPLQALSLEAEIPPYLLLGWVI